VGDFIEASLIILTHCTIFKLNLVKSRLINRKLFTVPSSDLLL
jgi:hypothetical protein